MSEYLVLVDENDRSVGQVEKIKAHELGLLHRAFSVLVFNSEGHLLVQQRALEKYHCGGLWSNTCCGHPRPEESTEAAAGRRLYEEMGFSCDLTFVDRFQYRTEFDNGLTEHEIDHVFVGQFDGDIYPNPSEVADWRWMRTEEVGDLLEKGTIEFTFWFREIWSRYEPKLQFVTNMGQ